MKHASSALGILCVALAVYFSMRAGLMDASSVAQATPDESEPPPGVEHSSPDLVTEGASTRGRSQVGEDDQDLRRSGDDSISTPLRSVVADWYGEDLEEVVALAASKYGFDPSSLDQPSGIVPHTEAVRQLDSYLMYMDTDPNPEDPFVALRMTIEGRYPVDPLSSERERTLRRWNTHKIPDGLIDFDEVREVSAPFDREMERALPEYIDALMDYRTRIAATKQGCYLSPAFADPRIDYKELSRGSSGATDLSFGKGWRVIVHHFEDQDPLIAPHYTHVLGLKQRRDTAMKEYFDALAQELGVTK
ncbi:MAG: hypothetical protein ACYS26_20825 [Planctomycetota bacterium]|jgi:hypothetical protein